MSSALLSLKDIVSERNLPLQQQEKLSDIAKGCQDVLDDLSVTLDRYQVVNAALGDLNKCVKRAWKRLQFEPEDVKDLRQRVTANIAMMNAVVATLTL